MRRGMRAVSLVAAALLLAACSAGAPGQWRVSAGDPASDGVGELSSHDGVPCPEALPNSSDDHGLGISSAATSTPGSLEFNAAWLCEYVTDNGTLQEDGNGMTYGWVRTGEPVEFSEAGLTELARVLSTIAPPEDPEGMACTDDLGPRYLVVTASGEDLTGIAVDDFGCRWVRLTEDPHVTAPGESEQLPAGYLLGEFDIVTQIKAAARA